MIRSIKQQAKILLKGLPGKYALFALPIIFTLVNLTISVREGAEGTANNNLAATLFPLLVILLLSLFTISALITILEVIRKERDHVTFSDIGRVFSSELFGKLLFLLLVKTLLITLWSIPIIIGGIALAVGMFFLWDMTFSAAPGTALVVFGGLMIVVGLVLLTLKNIQYGQAEFILYDQVKHNHYQGPINTIKQSKALMKGHVWENIVLYLSFIGWYLLTLPTLGLIHIYLLPYLTTTRSLYYQYLLEQKGQETPFNQAAVVSVIRPF